MIERVQEITLTPEELAGEFWKMPDDLQAQFFEHVSVIGQQDTDRFSVETQWLYLGERIRNEGLKNALHMIETVAFEAKERRREPSERSQF